MSQHHLRRLKPTAVWIVILLAGLAAGWLGSRTRRAEILTRLIEDARRSAVVINAVELRALAGTRADRETPAYAALKDRLQQLAAVDQRVRFVYVFRLVPETGKVIYLADSAKAGAKDESLPGDDYPQAQSSPGLQEIIRTGQPTTEGPLADDFGTWVTGYVRIAEVPSADPAKPLKEILGLDLAAANWRRELGWAGLQSAFYVWIVLGLPAMALGVKRRQGEQREVIRNLSEAMEQSHSAIMITDLHSQIEYANRGLCRQIGYSRRELIGRNWREFRDQQASAAAVGELVATVRAGRTWEGEWTNQRKDGTVYPVRGVVTPVKHRDGSIACFVSVFDDITEVKRKEAELRDARDLAQAGDRAKGQFLATMSHEVRTPLNGIVGFTSLLLDTKLSTEQREYVQTIRTSGEALIQLTGDILDYARIESGKLKLDPVACDPRECIEDALDLFSSRAGEKGLELLHRCADDVPAAIVADGGRLRQVLANLVGNAIKFTEQGEVEVTVRRAAPTAISAPGQAGVEPATGAGPEEACLLEFSIRDTGIGIPAEHHGKLFKPFSQVDDSATRRYGGTGLGLAICRNLVELMGGEISVASVPGQGSTFTFSVQVQVATPRAPVRDLAGLKVGLVLRPGALRRELAQLLTSWRAQLVEADTPAALDPASFEVALVLLDEGKARELAEQAEPWPGLSAKQLVGIVPITLSSEWRAALRSHFRLLVNKPLHHGALFALLSGARSTAPFATVPVPKFGFNILVVEDHPMNQRLLQRVLANLGCRFCVAENGRRAIDELTARGADYDLVLLDLHMPEMDGLAALREIRGGRAGEAVKSIWIIALTADAREEERAHGMEAGLNDYLTKPLQLPELEAALRRFRRERGRKK